MRKHLLLLVVVAVVAAVGSGCIFSPKDDPKPPVVIPPANDTPEGAILRLIWAYENKETQAYEDMLTGDFAFEFSNATDPELVQEWSTGWYKTDETISARNLHQGGVNQANQYKIEASRIDLVLANTAPVNDNSEGRDTLKYKVLATRVDAEIEVPENPADPTIYLMDNNFHRFFIVRGDVASGLSERQPADANKWYIWSWRDETAPASAPGVRLAASDPGRGTATTWGRLKGSTR